MSARGPVVAAYADGALDRVCANCSAPANAFCRRADGTYKAVPCCTRLVESNQLRHVTNSGTHPRTSGEAP